MRTRANLDRTVNYAIYQVGWFAAVLGAARGHSVLGAAVAFALVAAHVAFAGRRTDELRLVAICGGVGLLLETALIQAGILHYGGNPGEPFWPPPFAIALWMQLATTLRFSFSWLDRRPVAAALVGGLGGPFAFAAGHRIGAVTLGPSLAVALCVIAVTWAVALPGLFWFAQNGREEGTGRYAFPRESVGTGA